MKTAVEGDWNVCTPVYISVDREELDKMFSCTHDSWEETSREITAGTVMVIETCSCGATRPKFKPAGPEDKS
jgi:hypothetical protein